MILIQRHRLSQKQRWSHLAGPEDDPVEELGCAVGAGGDGGGVEIGELLGDLLSLHGDADGTQVLVDAEEVLVV